MRDHAHGFQESHQWLTAFNTLSSGLLVNNNTINFMVKLNLQEIVIMANCKEELVYESYSWRQYFFFVSGTSTIILLHL